MSSDKRHDPSKKRLRQARLEGRSAKSTVITQLFSIVGWAIGFFLGGWFGWVSNRTLLKYWAIGVFPDDAAPFRAAAAFAVESVLSGLAFSSVSAILAETLQSGVCLSPRLVSPDFKRLSPQSGLKRILGGIKTPWPHIAGLVAAAGAASLIFSNFWTIFRIGLSFREQPLAASAAATKIVLAPMLSAAIAYAGLDLFFRTWALRRELRMSDDELKRENKEEDGSPEMRAARRARQFEAVFTNLLAQVKKSKVIIVDRRVGND